MNINWRTAFPAFGITFLSIGSAHATDTQLWTESSLSQTLGKDKKTTFTALTIVRVGDDISRYTDRRLGVQVLRRVSRGLQVGGGYQLRDNDANIRRGQHENRFILNATYSAPLGKRFNFVNRNLLEYRDQTVSPDTVVYRNRLQINHPTRLFKTPVTPWIAGEVFYDFRLKTIPRTRYAVGLNRKFSPRFNGEVYLQRQIEGGGRIGDAHILGLNLRFSH